MFYKWIGAALIIAGCGYCGLSIANSIRWEERILRELIHVLRMMESELQYRLTPLPELCRISGRESSSVLRTVFRKLSEELEQKYAPDANRCMQSVLEHTENLPAKVRRHLRHLGRSLGRFDLPGQLQGLHAIQESCQEDLRALQNNRDIRLRSYCTLGFCSGAALVILFI